MHFENTYGHETQERTHVVAPTGFGCVDDLPYLAVVVLNRFHPVLMDFFPSPSVLERRPRGQRVGGGVEVFALVERRVGRDQVDGLRIDSPQYRQVVVVVQGPVDPILRGGGGQARASRWLLSGDQLGTGTRGRRNASSVQPEPSVALTSRADARQAAATSPPARVCVHAPSSAHPRLRRSWPKPTAAGSLEEPWQSRYREC